MTGWVSIHAYQDGDVEDLLVSRVAPVMEGLAARGAVDGWFFLRYWEGGPHIRVRARATSPEVGPVLRDALARYVREHPAPARLDQDTYAVLAARLASAEGRTGYERVLRQPGTVIEVPYRPEHEVYGDGVTLDAAERHFCESTALAVDVIRAGMSHSSRIGLALSVGMVTLADFAPDLGGLAAAFRRIGPRQGADDGQMSAKLHASYEASREKLRRQVDRSWRICTEGPGSEDPLARWLLSIRALRTVLEHEALEVEPVGSPYAWYLAQLAPDRRGLASVLLRCAHLFNNRIGVAVPDEMHVGYLTARALADVADGSGKR